MNLFHCQVFDPNYLNAVNDTLTTNTTLHITLEGVTLKLNCVEDWETSNSDCLGKKFNKYKQEQINNKSIL